MNKMIETVRFDPSRDTQDVANLYIEVFAGPPWYENTKCGSCGTFQGLETTSGQPCPKGCGTKLTPAYSVSETMDYVNTEAAKPNAIVSLVRGIDSQLEAFAWGYSIKSPQAFAQAKYDTPQMQRIAVTCLEQAGIEGAFFYISETGVARDRQGLGLSKPLFQDLEDVRKGLGLPGMLRTHIGSAMVGLCSGFGYRQALGTEVTLGRDPITQARKTIVGKTRVNGFGDTENAARALFVKPLR